MSEAKDYPSTSDGKKPGNTASDVDFGKLYYQHQYERFGQLERGNLTVTSFTVSITLVAFTFGFRDSSSEQLSLLQGVALPSIVMVSNLFALLYVTRSREMMITHQKRAKEMLLRHAPTVHATDSDKVLTPSTVIAGRSGVQVSLHFFLVLVAFVPIGMYLYEYLCEQ